MHGICCGFGLSSFTFFLKALKNLCYLDFNYDLVIVSVLAKAHCTLCPSTVPDNHYLMSAGLLWACHIQQSYDLLDLSQPFQSQVIAKMQNSFLVS